MANNRFLLDFDVIDINNDPELIPNEAALNNFIILTKDNQTLYININDMLIMMNEPNYEKFIKDTLEHWNTVENYQNVQQRLRNDPEYNTNPQLNNLIAFFNPNIFDTVEQIVNDATIIQNINRLVDTEDGEIAKLLLTTLFRFENSRRIFSRVGNVQENRVDDLLHLERGDHVAGNLNVDTLVAIREIITSIFIESPILDLSRMSERHRRILNIIREVKNVLVTNIETPRRDFYIRPFLRATCTGVRSRWLCDTLRNTHINCENQTAFSDAQIQIANDLVIDYLNNIPLVNIEKDHNRLIFKDQDQYKIGGKYQKKYLKYKAKYLQLKSM